MIHIHIRKTIIMWWDWYFKCLFTHHLLPSPSPLQRLRFVWINYVFSQNRGLDLKNIFLRKPGFVSTNFIPLQEFVSIGPLLLNFKHFFSMGRKVCYFLWNAIDSILGTRSIRPKCISFSLSILEIAKWNEAYEYLCPIGILNRK